ncbi:hypothetical protein [Lachnotalea sp. AF33-28]|uniref:hypothetical protein n=1 Tax=Lachnotalea sp. AF33-28 TaxID=2292046 RepID=UPI000E493AE1|nr:hypothetical protein [Lachnotalea sp. AF33-28]RHP36502.1 hypothetical protein DWZ56_02365 [Lachnotalea sp. AF33-28]
MSEILNHAVTQALQAAYSSFMAGKQKDYDYFIRVAREGVSAIRNLGHDPDYYIAREVEVPFLEGEVTLVFSFHCLDYPDRVLELYRLAEASMFGLPSRVLTCDMAYLPPCHDLYGYFHMGPKKEDKIAADFSKAVKLYGKLTGGGGAGADLLLQTAIALRHGNREMARELMKEAEDTGGEWIKVHTNNLRRQIELEEAK